MLSHRVTQLLEENLDYVYGTQTRAENTINKFGRNLNIAANSNPEIIWSGGATYPFQTSAQSIEIVSSSGLDTGGGTGAQTIQVFGLDENWLPINETKTLTGIVEVDLDNTYIRIFRAEIINVGATNSNVGTINIQVQGGGTILAIIEPTIGQTLMAIFSTSANQIAYLKKVDASIVRTTNVVRGSMQIRIREFEQAIKTKKTFSFTSDNSYQYLYVGSIILPPKTDIWLEKTFASAVSAISAEFDMIIQE